MFKILVLFFVLVCFSKKRTNPFTRSFKQPEPGTNFQYTMEQLKGQFAANEDNPFKDSGFVKVDEKNGGYLYYVFFENDKKDPNAPIIVWLNGGPGCSSLGGLFTEMGPYSVNPETLELEKRKGAWTEDYQMIFIDNPVGTGFSYVENKEGLCDDQICVQNGLYNFLEGFMAMPEHKHLIDNDLHIYGESYAGKYVPSFAHIIQEKGFKYNLKSIGIGDGMSFPEFQMTTYSDYALSTQMIDIGDYDELKRMENETATAIRNKDWVRGYNGWDDITTFLDEKSNSVNLYDVRTHVQYDFTFLVKYLNNPAVQKLMHTEGHRWEFCDGSVYQHLMYDMPKSVMDYIVQLLDESDVKVLIYSAQWDLIINTLSDVYGFMEFMPWKHQEKYTQQKRNHWRMPDGTWAGTYKKYANLYGCIVANSGHMMPTDQIEFSQDMVRNMIEGKW